MRSERQRPASINAVVLAPDAARSRAMPMRGECSEQSPSRPAARAAADTVRDGAPAESAEHRRGGVLQLRTDVLQRRHRVAADEELGALAWSALLRRT